MEGPVTVITTKENPRRVVLEIAGDAGSLTTEFPPMGAAWLAGQLMAAAIEILNARGGLGVSAENFAPVILWESNANGEGYSWNPSFLADVPTLHRNVFRCQKEGTPYRVTVEMIGDPLNAPKPKEG